jgi:glycosyltransferase involved in cell wall biosynthesis
MSSNKKITLMISSLTGGGAEGICVTIANSFANNGWHVDLVVLNLNNEAYLDRISNNVNLFVLNVNHSRTSIIPLLKYLYKSKIKTVLVFNHELAVILVILRLVLRLKIKIVSRNISVLSFKIKQFKQQNLWTRNVVRPLIKYFYNKIDHVVNQCHSMQEDLISLYPQLYYNSSVIYNPMSYQIENFSKTNDLMKIEKKNYLLCVGRLEQVKAFHYAIEAFAGIVNKFPNLRLKIVGLGSLEEELKQKAIDFSVANKVDFEGFQKDIIPYYLYAKATVLTSLYEGYPNVLVESIAMNTPVVAFDCPGGTNEIVQDGLNGYLVNNQDIEDLKNKLSILLLKKYNNENIKNSIKKNQTENVFKQYEKLINSLIKNL